MTIKQYQDKVDKWAQQFKQPYWSPLSIALRMSEESGELSRVINNTYGDKPSKETDPKRGIADELGDIIFTAICMANREGINLDEALERTMEKHDIRDKDRHERKEE